MEKRRRARINHSLNELKSLILDALNKDPSRHSKLEKADILEMTVRYLKSMERQQMAVEIARDPQVMNKYRAGFSECATEVSRYVSRIDGVDDGLKRRLIGHLSGCVTSLNSNGTATTTSVPVATPLQFPAGIAFPGMTISASPLQVQIPSGLFSNSSSSSTAVNLTLNSGSDFNNNSNRMNGQRTTESMMMDTKLTPPSSASSHQSFLFPNPSNIMSPITPSTPGTSNLYFWPRSQPLGSVSPGSSSSFDGSLSPTGSDSVFPDSHSEVKSPMTSSANGDVWRPW